MAKPFGETVREMRQARGIGLRAAAERLEISPAYLSRIERGKERPPKPEVVKRIALLLGGDADVLFKLAQSTDPDLAGFFHEVPAAARFLRAARSAGFTAIDFDVLASEIQRGRPSERARVR